MLRNGKLELIYKFFETQTAPRTSSSLQELCSSQEKPASEVSPQDNGKARMLPRAESRAFSFGNRTQFSQKGPPALSRRLGQHPSRGSLVCVGPGRRPPSPLLSECHRSGGYFVPTLCYQRSLGGEGDFSFGVIDLSSKTRAAWNHVIQLRDIP